MKTYRKISFIATAILLISLHVACYSYSNSYSQFGLSDTVSIAVNKGWNMISLPLIVPDPRVSIVFPHAISKAFFYDNSYRRTDSLSINTGYWIKFGAAETITVAGIKQHLGICSLVTGWNLVGGNSFVTPVSEVMGSPSSMITSHYWTYIPSVGYYLADTIVPGKSYWVKSQGVGNVAMAQWELIGLQSEEEVTSIVTHPYDPNIIYCGSASDFSSGHNGGVFKTTNGGVTWDTLVIGGSYSDLAIDPLHPDTVYAVSGTILMTPDGGKTWQVRADSIYLDGETRASYLAIDPSNSNTLYASTGGANGGWLYKSTDAGITWIGVPRNDLALNADISSLAIDPQHSSTIYAGAYLGVQKTTDGGNSWRDSGLDTSGTLIYSILIDPNQTQRIVAGEGLYGFFISNDGGSNWASFNEGTTGSFNGLKLTINPVTDQIYGVSSSGVYVRHGTNDSWIRIGMPGIQSIGYCGFKLDADNKTLYLGLAGIYRLRLP